LPIELFRGQHFPKVVRSTAEGETMPQRDLKERIDLEGNDRTREWAMVALAQSGGNAADAAATLSATMRENVDRIRWWAAIALAEINGDPATVPVLIECLEQGGAYMQYRAAKAVGAVGQAARPAIRQLKRLRRHRAFTVRDAAAEALERIAAAR
jgi:HEAT repeat protein